MSKVSEFVFVAIVMNIAGVGVSLLKPELSPLMLMVCALINTTALAMVVAKSLRRTDNDRE